MTQEKPYGSNPPQDPKKQLYSDFAGFHEKQVDNHKISLEIMQNQVKNHEKINEAIDKMSENNNFYSFTSHQLSLLKWTVIAIASSAGFFYLVAFVFLIIQNWFMFAITLGVSLYLTFTAVKKGSKFNVSYISNINRSFKNGRQKDVNAAQKIKRQKEASTSQRQ